MELSIDRDTLIKDVKRAFNELYPYLKLEFFENPSPGNGLGTKAKKIDENKLVCRISKFNQTGSIDMNAKTLVRQLENDFWNLFGLSVQVYRKSGNLWLETSLTDSWSLEKQNQEAESFHQHYSRTLDQKIEDDWIDSE